MTCDAGIPDSLCELSQETEALECRGCDKNKVGFGGFKPKKGSNYSDGSSHWHNQVKAFFKDPLIQKERRSKKKTTCSVKGCKTKSYCKGYCSRHYAQLVRGVLGIDNKPKICSFEGCDETIKSKGLCQKHYGQMRWKKRKIIRVKNGVVI